MTRIEARTIRAKLEQAAQYIPEIEAYDAVFMYPKWTADGVYTKDKTWEYNRKLYKCRQAHTGQSDYTPGKTPALWELIPPPGESGTHDNPIAFEQGMSLVNGLYYTQNDVLYLCIRDSGIPMYFDLSVLVSQGYVEVAT